MNRLRELMKIYMEKAEILHNIFYFVQNIFLIFCFQGCYLFPHLKFLNIKTRTGQQASSDLRPCESPEHAQVHSKVFRKLFDVFAKPRI